MKDPEFLVRVMHRSRGEGPPLLDWWGPSYAVGLRTEIALALSIAERFDGSAWVETRRLRQSLGFTEPSVSPH